MKNYNKRYMLFAGTNMPYGGMVDYRGCGATIQEAYDLFKMHQGMFSWYHIFDVDKRQIVEDGTASERNQSYAKIR